MVPISGESIASLSLALIYSLRRGRELNKIYGRRSLKIQIYKSDKETKDKLQAQLQEKP